MSAGGKGDLISERINEDFGSLANSLNGFVDSSVPKSLSSQFRMQERISHTSSLLGKIQKNIAGLPGVGSLIDGSGVVRFVPLAFTFLVMSFVFKFLLWITVVDPVLAPIFGQKKLFKGKEQFKRFAFNESNASEQNQKTATIIS